MKRSIGILVFQQTVMQIVSNRPCDPTTLPFPPSKNFGQFLAALRQNGPKASLQTFLGTSGIRPRSALRSRSR